MTIEKYYKAAQPDGFDFYTSKTINYRDNIGKTVKCPDTSDTKQLCSSSVIHASPNPLGVFVGAKIPCSLYVVEGTSVCGDNEKSGFKKFKVLYEIPQENLNKLFGFNYLEVINPINPFLNEPPEITDIHIKLLKNWDSVWASVRDSVRDSVRGSVRGSVRDSVWDSVRAYTGSLFPNIKKWKYCENVKSSGYPFQPLVDLWKMGIVPSFDGKLWRLHTKNGIAWEGKI